MKTLETSVKMYYEEKLLRTMWPINPRADNPRNERGGEVWLKHPNPPRISPQMISI
jgi:hypothetical protein